MEGRLSVVLPTEDNSEETYLKIAYKRNPAQCCALTTYEYMTTIGHRHLVEEEESVLSVRMEGGYQSCCPLKTTQKKHT